MRTIKTNSISYMKIFFSLIAFILLITGCVQQYVSTSQPTNVDSCLSKGWPHDGSDLLPDPAVTYGTLANGLRYVIMPNEEPKDRVGIYLDIQAGSLAEKEDQRGYAHFLEHMLFNGTTHYPPGTMVEYFQSIGMAFGPDTNAHTSFDETVYRLFLPDGTEKHLSDGLMVMADYARGALLLEDEVERERGIILAEKRTRDSVNYRLWENSTEFTFAGTRLAERFPIGTDEALRKADSASLRSYYDTWYRPENMILVVVGDVEVDLVKKMVMEHFSTLTAPEKQVECFDLGKVQETGTQILYTYEPELGSTDLTISTHWNVQPEKDTIARQQQDMKKYVAVLMLRNRLKQLVRKENSPLTKAVAYAGDYLQRFGSATITASVEGKNWQEGLQLIDQTIRQIQEQGFLQRELEQVKKEVMADLKKEVNTATSRDSRKLADDIIGALNRNMVFLSPEQELQLYGPVVESLTLAEINEVIQSMWGHDNRNIIVAGTAEMEKDSAEAAIRDVYGTAQKARIPTWQENGAVVFPYFKVPDNSVAVADKEYFSDIDIHRFSFANGTILNVKKTSFKPNQVRIEVHFGAGKEAEDIPGLSMLSQSVVNESGTGRLTKVELDEALAGSNVNVSFRIGEESFFFDGNGLSEELELLFQLISTRLLDPGFREDAYRLSMDRFRQQYEKMRTSVEGVMQLEGERFLAGGNPHAGYPPYEQFRELTLEQVREWLMPFFEEASLEISVVGDVEPEVVQEMVSKYFGGLARRGAVDAANRTLVFPTGEKLEDNVETQIDKTLVVVAWPTEDFWDISRTRRLNSLASVLSDRLRVEIREKLGAVYSPSVYNNSSRTVPGYGVLRAMLTVDPKQAEEIAQRVREAGEKLARDGLEQEELQRSLEPILTSIKDMKETNRYWLQSVMALSSRHPEQLEWPLSIEKDYGAITAKEISDFAKRYFQPDNAAQIILTPLAQ